MKLIHTLIKSDSFGISIKYDEFGTCFFILERPNVDDFKEISLDRILLEIYEDENIWLTNEQRKQLKQLRHGK